MRCNYINIAIYVILQGLFMLSGLFLRRLVKLADLLHSGPCLDYASCGKVACFLNRLQINALGLHVIATEI